MGKDMQVRTGDTKSMACTQAGQAQVDAFERAFASCRGRLFALARRMVGSDADAEDVLQDAFMNGWRHVDQFRGDAQWSTWLYRVTYNTALMHLRTRRRKGASSLDALPGDVREHVTQRAAEHTAAAPDFAAPAHAVWARAFRSDFEQALEALRPVDRSIVSMRLVQGRDTREVGASLDMSTSAVKTRLHRARKVLERALDHHLDA